MRNIVFTYLILIPFIVQSQDEIDFGPNIFLKFSAGLAMPMGDFGDKDLDNNDAEFVNTEFNFSGQFDYFLNKNVAVSFSALYTVNSVDKDEINSQYRSTGFNGELNYDASSWSTTNVLFGLSGIIEASKKINIHGSLLGGLSISSSPTIKYDASLSRVSQKNGRTGSFGYQFKVGPSYQLSETIDLLLDFSFFGTHAEFEGVEVEYKFPSGTSAFDKIDFDQEIYFRTINLGLIVKL